MLCTWRLSFDISPESVNTTPIVGPLVVDIEFQLLGNMSQGSGATNPNHYVMSGIEPTTSQVLYLINSAAATTPIQVGIVRDNADDGGRLVMTEPGAGAVQTWNLDPRTTVDIDADGDDIISPFGQIQNMWMTIEVPETVAAVQIDNPSGTAVCRVIGIVSGSLAVHMHDQNV